jgi:ArsR family transcriptional regulator
MCQDEKKQCQKPENLKDTPRECSPEQIRECHGNVEEHPCDRSVESQA